MAYWIFKCDPETYRLAERLKDPKPALTWRVTRYQDEVNKGDVVFLWVADTNRGIRAIMRVDEPPRLMKEFESEQAYQERDTEEKIRVVGTLMNRNVNLTKTQLRDVPGLEELSVFHGVQRGTNFRVTQEQGVILSRLIADGGC